MKQLFNWWHLSRLWTGVIIVGVVILGMLGAGYWHQRQQVLALTNVAVAASNISQKQVVSKKISYTPWSGNAPWTETVTVKLHHQTYNYVFLWQKGVHHNLPSVTVYHHGQQLPDTKYPQPVASAFNWCGVRQEMLKVSLKRLLIYRQIV